MEREALELIEYEEEIIILEQSEDVLDDLGFLLTDEEYAALTKEEQEQLDRDVQEYIDTIQIIDDLDLEIYEVTLCVTPMNPKSYITNIIQKPDPMICPECYDTNQLEFDSSLRTR